MIILGADSDMRMSPLTSTSVPLSWELQCRMGGCNGTYLDIIEAENDK
jgi:hypothetical protein